MMWYGDGMGGWGFVLMAVSTVVFWGVLIAGGIALFRYLNRTAGQPGGGETRPTPERLLAERFAGGEIDEDEYRRRLDTLRRAGHVAKS
ncbi:MAG: SHOCT domain-containing protein [Acidimicrobiales bacterium]